ncbi:MAG: family 43 glycosylhydrolase [Thermoleophilaceae bacterium]
MRLAASQLLAAFLLFACMAAGADARALEAEHGRVQGPGATVIQDPSARAGRAVVLEGKGTVKRLVVTPKTTALIIRARGTACEAAPRMRVAVDGRRRFSSPVLSRGYRAHRFVLRAKPGRRVLELGLVNPRRSPACRRRLVIDRITLRNVPEQMPVASMPVAVQPQAPASPPPLLPFGYRNPVAPSSPDPMVLRVGAENPVYYAFSTGEGFPISRSTDLVRWEPVGRAMNVRPAWSHQTGEYHPWAPSVIERAGRCPNARRGTSCFVLFYTALHASFAPGPQELNCVGVATSPYPTGPYTDLGPLEDLARTRDSVGRPLGCGDDRGFSNIDPAPFVDPDSGNAYLYLSTAVACNQPTGLCESVRELGVVPLSADFLTAAGPREKLFSADRGNWEEAPFAPVVENPWMEKRDGTYLLLYSGGDYTGPYGMGYATSSSPTGPFVKAPQNPFLREQSPALSVGGGMVVTGPNGGDWLAYHGRDEPNGPRTLRIDPLLFAGGGLLSTGPTTTEQPLAP